MPTVCVSCDADVSPDVQLKSAIVRLVHTRGLTLDDLLSVFDAKHALAAKLQPKYIQYYLVTYLLTNLQLS